MNLGHDGVDLLSGFVDKLISALLDSLVQFLLSLLTGLFPTPAA